MTFDEDLDKGKFKSLDQVIPRLRELRDQSDHAEEAFVRACMAVEDSPLWKGSESVKQVTFGHWLQKGAHVCSAERYDRGAAALRTPEIAKVVPTVGLAAGRILVECPQEHRQKVSDSLVAYTKDHGGGMVPERTAEGIRNNLVGGKERESQTANVHARIVQLAEENKALKAKVRSLETEIRHLKKRLGKVIEKEQPQA